MFDMFAERVYYSFCFLKKKKCVVCTCVLGLHYSWSGSCCSLFSLYCRSMLFAKKSFFFFLKACVSQCFVFF